MQLLRKKKKSLLENWMKLQLADEALREDLITNEELRSQSDDLLTNLISVIDNENTDVNSSAYEPIVNLLSDVSMSRARQGFSPRETATYIYSLKEALISAIQDETKDPATLGNEIMRISKIMDSLAIITFETYLKGREDVILRQTDEIAEISTPVIRVWEGIVALPIIGTLDSARTQVVMESLLQQIVDTGSSIAILDISGVPAVDSLVAQHLIKTVSATRLMGAECVISGIRPEIAQTIVHLGIDLSGITTKATLESALKFAFNLLRFEIKKKI